MCKNIPGESSLSTLIDVCKNTHRRNKKAKTIETHTHTCMPPSNICAPMHTYEHWHTHTDSSEINHERDFKKINKSSFCYSYQHLFFFLKTTQVFANTAAVNDATAGRIYFCLFKSSHSDTRLQFWSWQPTANSHYLHVYITNLHVMFTVRKNAYPSVIIWLEHFENANETEWTVT